MNNQDAKMTAQQQTLRAVTLALASACGADLGVLATLLNCASQGNALAPESAESLRDLAFGIARLAEVMQPTHHSGRLPQRRG